MNNKNSAGEALDLNKTRAEFEAWARSAGWTDTELTMRGIDSGEYFPTTLNAAWKAWCAALARAGSAAPAGQQAEPVGEVWAYEVKQDAPWLPEEKWLPFLTYHKPTESPDVRIVARYVTAPVSAAPAAPTAELIANVILRLIGECVMDWKAGLNSDDPEEDAFHSDAEELRVLVDLVNKALAAPTAAEGPSDWQTYALNLRAVLERGYKSLASAAICQTRDGEAAWYAMGEALKLAAPLPTGAGEVDAKDARITALRSALQEISETRFGHEGDCGTTRIADDALYADEVAAQPKDTTKGQT